jgi:hypothetical protein
MPLDPVAMRLETIRSLNNTQRLLLQAIDDAGDQQRYAGTLIFNSLVFLSDEIKAQIEFLEDALRDWNNECTSSNKDN